MNVEVLKLPLGFIRIVQLPFIIIAFASMGGWGIIISHTYSCVEKIVNTTSFAIDTFRLTSIDMTQNLCNNTGTVYLFDDGVSSSPGFFVFTGIVSLLFVLAMLAIYCFVWGMYESNNRVPMIDFVVTVVLTVFWFFGTIAWWSGAAAVGSLTDAAAIQKLLGEKVIPCNNESGCPVTKDGGYGSLVISVFAGWACVLLFVADCWFIYKETIWFRNRQLPPTITAPNPAAAASPYSQQQSGGYIG
uniref:MARVEL domain-containing protein n=1 Tax=Plectus sambesii TaxID=2011161 RepID=A0A914VX04_9BILA